MIIKLRSALWPILSVLSVFTTVLLLIANAPGTIAQQPIVNIASQPGTAKTPPPSGIYDFRDRNFGTGLTECPQAGNPDGEPAPLDRRQRDRVEEIGNGGDGRRANQDYSCFPQNETSIAVNPRNPRNVVAGANDYRLGWGTSGFYASTDHGDHWYDGIIPFPSLPSGDNLDGGGDPALVFDRDGVVYYAGINFNRTDDTNGVFVSRSTNGGFTWTRPCVAIDATPGDPTDDAGRCGSAGDPRLPGDGVVAFGQDNNTVPDGSIPFNDKEYIAAGPRPAGVQPVCFRPFSRNPVACDPAVVGSDRLYVTWTLFTATNFNIVASYSDDQGRSWSPTRAISGGAAFCEGGAGSACDANQFSVPTVSPATGALYVAFENFNTPAENQYLLVRSRDGGQTFEGPFQVSPVFDVNYPRAGTTRPDCAPRGQQQGRAVLTNSCFRVNSGGNVVVDKRGGAFADDLYLVFSDNRNGTPASSNTDVFLFKSIDGGTTWIGPTRVNDDPSQLTGSRDDRANTNVVGSDQWFPWADIGPQGDLNVVFYDRRLDLGSVASEWPGSRQRPGNYLTWFWGAQCRVTTPDSRECTAATPGGLPFKNFTISEVPSNMDYAFRAGIFIGDYNNVAIGPDNTAQSFWTDARNGRSSRNQTGRNPACEQADVFVDRYNAQDGRAARGPQQSDELFLVTPCPSQAVDR